jgi:hypothetical protein
VGTWCVLWNSTKRERIAFEHVAATTPREVAGNPAASAIVAWYLIQNPGDQISVLTEGNVPPELNCTYSEALKLPDRTEAVVAALIAEGILKDVGFQFRDEDEPETVFVRDLRNVWMD